jgi:hypothetical protein
MLKKKTMVSSSSQAEKKRKKHRRKKNAKKGGSLPLFSCFCIWDEALFLPFPLHIPSTLHVPATLSSPPFSSRVLQNFVRLKLGSSIELSRWSEQKMW